MLARLAVAALLVLVASASGALADARRALFIGNSTCAHAARLPNTENDATNMAAALRRLGFEVTMELDTDCTRSNGALRAFSRRSSGAEVSLVFHAGHGMELDGVNHLLPADPRLEHDTDVRSETATLDDVLAATTGATLRAELNEDLLGHQTVVAYAVKAGMTAAAGRGRNSPYTRATLDDVLAATTGASLQEVIPTGSAVVEVNLDDVAVFVDGEPIGSADNGKPLRINGLPVGLHEFMGVRRDYEPSIQELLVRPGQQVTVTLDIRYQRREDEAARRLVEHGERLLFTGSVARSQSRRDLDERARDLFMAALEKDPAYARAAYLLGRVQQLLGNRQESVDAYGWALRIDPTDVEARVHLAGAFVELGDSNAAVEVLRDAARLAEPTDEFYAGLAHVYWDKGAWEQAIGEARRAIALNASNGQAYLWKADALRQLAENDGMSPVVRQSLYLEARDDYRTLLNLTNFESSLGNRQDVLREYRKEGYLGLCLTEHKLNNLLRAREYCERAIGYLEDSPIAHYVLGNINRDLYTLYQTCDYLTAAAHSYSRMIEINPYLAEADNARFYLEQITGLALGCSGAQVPQPGL